MSSVESFADRRGDSSRPSPARTISAIDIAGDPALRAAWFLGHEAPADDVLAALPAGGIASPLGYWLVTHGGPVPPADNALTLVVTAPGDPPPEFLAQPDRRHHAGRRAHMQAVTIQHTGGDGGALALTIGPRFAHVCAAESAWEALREPVILAVCLAWRFHAVDAVLEALMRTAYDHLAYANAPGLTSLMQGRRLVRIGLEVRAAIVDITHFQQPLTDPRAYLSSARSARIFRRLAERLGLDDWSESIDQRAEVVEATFDTIAERLSHLKSHAHDVVLGAIIVAILVLDILMRFWEASL